MTKSPVFDQSYKGIEALYYIKAFGPILTTKYRAAEVPYSNHQVPPGTKQNRSILTRDAQCLFFFQNV